jgi:ATP-dependent RNA helicase RhlE
MFSTLFRGRKAAPSAAIAIPQPAKAHPESSSTHFRQMGLHETIARGAEAAGYTEPTPIQQQAIPIVLAGRDLIGSAQTGTGKTAAFALPILSRLLADNTPAPRNGCRVLVLGPTRELALQVEANFREYARFTDLRTVAVYGGVGYGKQRDEIERGVDVLVATPGRLLDFMEQRVIDLRSTSILVLDEVDRMLDMGFLPGVKRIVGKCPAQRQTLFFSATVPPEIEELTRWALRDPKIIEVGQRRSPAETVAHAFYPVESARKFDLLVALLEEVGTGSTLIFTRTKHGADRVARKLMGCNRKAAVLHGNRSQSQRVRALEGFRDGSYPILVATDIAARGIDVAGVTHVINFDVPKHPEDYVHRIGRTGRAQQEGDAFTLLSGSEDADAARAIERFIGAKVPRKEMRGFPVIEIAATESNGQSERRFQPAGHSARRRPGGDGSNQRRRRR